MECLGEPTHRSKKYSTGQNLPQCLMTFKTSNWNDFWNTEIKLFHDLLQSISLGLVDWIKKFYEHNTWAVVCPCLCKITVTWRALGAAEEKESKNEIQLKVKNAVNANTIAAADFLHYWGTAVPTTVAGTTPQWDCDLHQPRPEWTSTPKTKTQTLLPGHQLPPCCCSPT